jgi:poly-gamma-glutamate capsule biosynthesis protein CapA/YwtB (metallophosphatase superfamily)
VSLLVPCKSDFHRDSRPAHMPERTICGAMEDRPARRRRAKLQRFARLGPAVVLAGALALTPLSSPKSPVINASPASLPSGFGASKPTVTLAFVGDILLNYSVGDLIKREGPMAPWEGVKDILSRADFAIGNLECAVGTTGEPLPGKEWTFRADPATLDGLSEAGIDAVSLANNHTLDFGPECLLETVALVRQAGVQTAGAGANLAEAFQPVIWEKNGIRVGLLAINMIFPNVSWGAGEESPGQAIDDTWHMYTVHHVRQLASQVDIVAVYVHWSEERQEVPTDWAMRMARALREAGAHLVIGSHPHILNGFDYDGRCLTAYSLGNFVFTTRPEIPRLQIGAVLEVTVSKEGVESASVIPTRIVWGRTIVDESPEKEETLRWLSSLSNAWQTDVDRQGNILPALFSDLRRHWAQATVTRLVLSGAIEGYPDNTFRPEAMISKGEFAALFSRTVSEPADYKSAVAPQGFTLCDETDWQYPYMAYLASQGLIPGSDPSWEPSSPCSRLDALTVMRKHAEQTVAQAVYEVLGSEEPADEDEAPAPPDRSESPEDPLDSDETQGTEPPPDSGDQDEPLAPALPGERDEQQAPVTPGEQDEPPTLPIPGEPGEPPAPPAPDETEDQTGPSIPEEQTPSQVPANLRGFVDLYDLDPESVDTASWAVEVGLLRGYDDATLRLGGTVTRAEMAELIWRYINIY